MTVVLESAMLTVIPTVTMTKCLNEDCAMIHTNGESSSGDFIILVPQDDDIIMINNDWEAVLFSWRYDQDVRRVYDKAVVLSIYHDRIAIVGGNRGNPHSDDFMQTSSMSIP
ncbi:hypothetical protein ACFE04_022476 [Oxalis oulophora]